jgi:hypothetical protein
MESGYTLMAGSMITKVCNYCKQTRHLEEFHKNKTMRDGRSRTCKKCAALLNKQYTTANREIIKARTEAYYAKYPWKVVLISIKDRCNNPNTDCYRWYGGRGIKCLITEQELKELWVRDKADSLQKPTIDRLDNDGSYTFENCRFIEFQENLQRANERNYPKDRTYKTRGMINGVWTCTINKNTKQKGVKA